MRSSVLLVLLGIASAVHGCGGTSSGGGGGAGGATGAGGMGGGPACSSATGAVSGTTCNVVEAGGACVTPTFSTASAPVPAGGTFAGGSNVP